MVAKQQGKSVEQIFGIILKKNTTVCEFYKHYSCIIQRNGHCAMPYVIVSCKPVFLTIFKEVHLFYCVLNVLCEPMTEGFWGISFCDVNSHLLFEGVCCWPNEVL